MLEPAMLHKESVINGLKKHIYDDEMIYYSGWNGYTIPNIPDEFESSDYRYAILDKEKVIGYFCYHYDMYSKTLSNFGLYSFDRGNPIIGIDVFREIRRIIKEYQPHRIEWRMIGGNPVEKHYDKFCNKYHGRKYVLEDVLKDRYGKYHNDVIYEIIFEQDGEEKMKCTECPKYNECVITSDLRRKRKGCTYARDKKPMTNYDRIKNMSIDEMVLFLGRKPYCTLENDGEVDCIYGWHGCRCEEHAKEWLESEVIE